MNIKITKTFDSVSPQINDIIRTFTYDKKKVLQAAGDKFVELTKKNFGSGSPYRGNKWAPYSREYAKKHGATPTLVRSGNLRNSIRVSAVRENYIEISTNVPYAGVHLFGSKKKNIPPRIFFPMEQSGQSSWRPVFAAEKELFQAISRQLTNSSKGALPSLGMPSQRSTFTHGNPATPAS